MPLTITQNNNSKIHMVKKNTSKEAHRKYWTSFKSYPLVFHCFEKLILQYTKTHRYQRHSEKNIETDVILWISTVFLQCSAVRLTMRKTTLAVKQTNSNNPKTFY